MKNTAFLCAKVFLILHAFILSAFWSYGQSPSPNVIVILAGDQSWGSTSLKMDPNDKMSSTPSVEVNNLVKLARNGVVFSNAYAPSPVSKPSRIGLLTGRYPMKLGITNDDNLEGKPKPYRENYTNRPLETPISNTELRDDWLLLPEYLKLLTSDYRAGHFGSWKLSNKIKNPCINGFDESTLESENEGLVLNDTEQITDDALLFIKNSVIDGKSFYLNFWLDESPRILDKSVGKIVDQLQELALMDNTIIVFCSDNGSPSFKGQYLSGTKGSIGEGGLRVPMFVYGPKINAKGYIDDYVSLLDLYPSICDWIGYKPPYDQLDGKSFYPLLQGFDNRNKETSMYFHYPHYNKKTKQEPASVLIKSGMKYIQYYGERAAELYNLKEDITEQNDLSPRMAKEAKSMKKELNKFLKESNVLIPVAQSPSNSNPKDQSVSADCAPPNLVAHRIQTSKNRAVLSSPLFIKHSKLEINYRKRFESSWSKKEMLGQNYILIENLDPGQAYEYRIRAKCEGGKYSKWSQEALLITSEDNCISPLLKTIQVDGDVINIDWEDVKGAKVYYFRYRTEDGAWKSFKPTKSGVALSGLESGNYVFGISSICYKGCITEFGTDYYFTIE